MIYILQKLNDSPASGLFIYSLIILMLCMGRLRFWALLAAVTSLPLSQLGLSYFLNLSARLLPNVLDQTLAALDGSMGIQPSAQVMRLLRSVPNLWQICGVVYLLLLVDIGLSAGFELRSGRIRGLGLIPNVLIAGVLGYGCYFYVPAVGTVGFFGSDYLRLLAQPDLVGGLSDFSTMPRNCVPSLHTTWAVLAFLATRERCLTLRIFSGAFLLLTVLACLGLGGHYFVDIVVAAPFVLVIRAIGAIELPWKADRATSVVIGICLMLLWFEAIRGTIPPTLAIPMAPTAMVATLAISFLWERRLRDAERRAICGSVQTGGFSVRVLPTSPSHLEETDIVATTRS